MQNRSILRFIHASNFRLGQVVSGIGQVPETLRDALLTAPWRAAGNVFEQAIAHRVDFVLLNGDILPTGVEQGRALGFLCEQFGRLEQHGIQVFWRTPVGTEFQEWGGCFHWPGNVRFVTEQSDVETFVRDGHAVATIFGGLDFDSRNTFGISLVNGTVSRSTADYTATCASVRDDSVAVGQTTHSPGSPQGLGFNEPGPHSCSLVEVDHNNSVSIGAIETNVAVWESLRVSLAQTGASVEDTLRSHMQTTDGVTRIYRFVLDAQDSAVAMQLEQLDTEGLRSRLLDTHRTGTAGHWIAEIETGAGVLVAANAPAANACVNDFRQLLHQQGSRYAETLRDKQSLISQAPQQQLLNGVARLANRLLS